MSRPKLLSLCTGYLGLDMAVEAVLDAHTVAVSDIDPGAAKILAHRAPDAPNLGDVKTIHWEDWAGVEIMTAGYPCQPFSHAGKRAGTDDPRHIFPFIADGIRRVGPRLVFLENVRGHLALGFDVVLGTLADIGYDAQWVCLRASDVGACHKRERLFIVATPADAEHDGSLGTSFRRSPSAGEVEGRLLQPQGSPTDPRLTLLPTPAVNDMGRGKTVEAWDEWTARMKTEHGNGNGHGPSLEIEAMRLLPTPNAQLANDSQTHRSGGRTDELLLGGIATHQQFGKYAAAIARQEAAFGYPAPPPTEPTGKNGAHRLSPRFVEWMQGCEPGWVTDVPGLSRNDQLKALGNGVVRQQAAAAIRFITAPVEAAA